MSDFPPLPWWWHPNYLHGNWAASSYWWRSWDVAKSYLKCSMSSEPWLRFILFFVKLLSDPNNSSWLRFVLEHSSLYLHIVQYTSYNTSNYFLLKKAVQKCGSYFEAESLGWFFQRVSLHSWMVVTGLIQSRDCLRFCTTAMFLLIFCIDERFLLAPCSAVHWWDRERREMTVKFNFVPSIKNKEKKEKKERIQWTRLQKAFLVGWIIWCQFYRL